MPRPVRRRAPREVAVLRLGHRPGRDPRVTTHVALVARAWGARRMFVHPSDPGLAERMRAVGRRWGGTFDVVGAPDWRSTVAGHRGQVVHLTMYGRPLATVVARLRRLPRLLIVVGGPKVPPQLFRDADWNVAVGAQPHSEVAALAVFLDRLNGGMPRPAAWRGAEQVIVPTARGKRIRASQGHR